MSTGQKKLESTGAISQGTRRVWIGIAAATGVLASLAPAAGQTVMLPTFNNFSVRSSVMVPDGGRMMLGGIKSHSEGAISRGTPFLGNLPGANRLFKNRAISRTDSNSNMTVTADIIIMEEYEQQVLAEAERRQAAAGFGINQDVLRKAAFITKHVGTNSSSKSRYKPPR